MEEKVMSQETVIGGVIIVLAIAFAWFLFRMALFFALWVYGQYRWNKVKRDFNKEFYRERYK
jgi:hypothetical protein